MKDGEDNVKISGEEGKAELSSEHWLGCGSFAAPWEIIREEGKVMGPEFGAPHTDRR